MKVSLYMSVGIIKERYEKLNTFLEKNLGALVLGILLGVLPITIYGIPFTLSLAENLLIGKHETYDLYSICKVLVAAFLSVFLLLIWTNDVLRNKKRVVLKKSMFWVILYLLLNVISVIRSEYLGIAIFGQFERFEGLVTQLIYVTLFF